MVSDAIISIKSDTDVVSARQHAKELAKALGMSSVDTTLVATAVSELARNIVEYAKRGEMLFSIDQHGGRRCLVAVARDQGPGIPNIELAMQDGYSTSHSLGLGLPGARRLMDDFEIVSEPGRGTTVTVRKWAN